MNTFSWLKFTYFIQSVQSELTTITKPTAFGGGGGGGGDFCQGLIV